MLVSRPSDVWCLFLKASSSHVTEACLCSVPLSSERVASHGENLDAGNTPGVLPDAR